MDVEFLLLAYFISLSVDWIFQSDWQAVNKSHWDKEYFKPYSLLALLSHSGTYAFLTSIITLLLLDDVSHAFVVFWTLFISHAIIDTRIPVKWIMRMKGMTWKQINDHQTYSFMHIGIDHRLHELVLLVLAFIV